MKSENILFITNELFVDETRPEGGVRLCTYDFIDLLKLEFNVIIFPVQFNRSLIFRIKFKLGLDNYEEYNTKKYLADIKISIAKNGIKKIFINLSNAIEFAKLIKEKIDSGINVILCSHGNESGDFLHQSVRFRDKLSLAKKHFSAIRLGNILQKELFYRLHYIDLVLTVSLIEDAIEKWLGAKDTFFVPRTFKKDFILWNPVNKRVGFIGDISHLPNYYGVLKLCEALKKNNKDINAKDKIELRIIGIDNNNLKELIHKFDFISYVGYLEGAELTKEVSTWNYFLNLVFYYSKGVSTKLEKGFNLGLPVMSTPAGNRGYILDKFTTTFESPEQMANELLSRIEHDIQIKKDRQEVIEIVNNSITKSDIMNKLLPILKKI